ncbi:MAG: transglycosylase SLT domain-containing protein, partial [Syntrophales bacterium LBB04]|nr:transglycosylase SLT domain-containing protein [Syntrophales bacterium LBB04]
MARRGVRMGLLPPLIFLFLLAFFIPEQFVAAAANETPTDVEVGITDKVLPERSTQAEEKQDALKKPPVIKKSAMKPQLETLKNTHVRESKLEVEQDIMEKALELLNNSQDFWVNGDIEYALDALDQAYAILLDTNGDADIARQKDDLRLLISKKILAIYTSRQTVTNGRRSEIPNVMNAEVEREIRSFQTVERDFFIQAYQRAAFFRPVVVTALRKAGLPEELSWLPLVESGFKIRALSIARALGLWQFIPSTGYKYGLNRDDWVDERMDVEKSTQAAIDYMKDLHDMFGDWLTVLAGYNCGEGRVLRIISRQHIDYLDRFWDLYRQLPNETARYVPRFLATLHIIKDPKKYGLDLELLQAEKQPAFVYAKVKTNRILNLQQIAQQLDISEEHLSTLNAELRFKKTPDRDYSLKIPPESIDKFAQVIDEIPPAEKPRADELHRPLTVQHKVKTGDTIASIANRYRTTTGAIRKQNRFLAKSNLKVGQTLVIAVRDSRKVKGNE